MIIAELNTIDTQFMAKANNDININADNMQTEVSSVTTRTIVDNSDQRKIVFDTVSNIPEAYKIDTKPWVERPFYCDEVKFKDTDKRFALLSTAIKQLPGDVARSNTSLLNIFKTGALGRPDLLLNISMAGTISHAGCILAAILPPLNTYPQNAQYLLNTALSGPHAFLFANEATSVVLPVPWYCNTDMMTMDFDATPSYTTAADLTFNPGNYGTLVFIVLNPLAVSNGSSTQLSIVVEACFRNLELAIPTPRFITFKAQSCMLKEAELPHSIHHQLDEIKELIKHKKIPKIQLIAIITSLINMASSLLKSCLSADSVLPDLLLKPQAGVLAAMGSAILPGLVGSIVTKGTKLFNDVLDKGIATLRKYTGLHNPNTAVIETRVISDSINFANMVDGKQFFEKLDPYANSNRIVQEHIFGTTVDEMDITHITSKDQYLGTFKVSVDDPVGKLLWARPISPFQGGARLADTGIVIANNIELMHTLHRAWRGGLKLKIQSVMNNKQQVKLKVIKYYNPSLRALNQQPVYSTVVNAPSHLLEFTQGAQTHEVSLPYLCRNALCPRMENTDAEAFMHGIYYLYVAQPLVTADGSPSTVEFNIYMSGEEDLQFYGYTTANIDAASYEMYSNPTLLAMEPQISIDPPGSLDSTQRPKASVNENTEAARMGRIFKDLDSLDFSDFPNMDLDLEPQSGNMEVMNEPQEQTDNMTAERSLPPIECTRLQPNINMRDIFRRMYKTQALTVNIPPGISGVQNYKLASFIYEDLNAFYPTPMGVASRMFYGKSVGFKFRISITRAKVDDESAPLADVQTRVYYQPQSMNIQNATGVIAIANTNVAAYPDLQAISNIGEPPMPFQLTPVKVANGCMIYEFTVPDTSFFKFMGSPNKYQPITPGAYQEPHATADFGSFMLEITNVNDKKSINLIVEQHVGLTDESRMGFHNTAPPTLIRKKDAYYLGTSASATGVLPNSINTKLYYGTYGAP